MSEIVEAGYDAMARRYLDWSVECDWPARRRYLGLLLDALPEGSEILELGCGPGLPVTRALVEHHRVTALDISREQLELARANAPGATFLKADMTEADFPAGSFDAVAAFYSLEHVPRERHPELLARIASWLRPGGLLVASMDVWDNPGDVEDWLGAPMYFSHFDSDTNRGLVRAAGFELLRDECIDQVEHGELAPCLWIVACKL